MLFYKNCMSRQDIHINPVAPEYFRGYSLFPSINPPEFDDFDVKMSGFCGRPYTARAYTVVAHK